MNLYYSRKWLIGIIILLLIIIYSAFSIFIFKSDPILHLVHTFFEFQLRLAENFAQLLIRAWGFEVSFINHEIFFSHSPEYYSVNEYILKDWTKYLLFKKWGVFILFLIWIIKSPLKNKIINTGLLYLIYYISVVSALLILTVIAPSIVNIESENRLHANIFGSLLMMTFLVLWMKNNKQEIHNSLRKLGIKSKKWIIDSRELIIVIFIFYILNALIIPLFSFSIYSQIITTLTEKILNVLNFEVLAEGIYLHGENESLEILKSCLGLKTILLFTLVIYITGNSKKKWVFIISGFFILNIVNIIRLVVLFNYVQKNGDYRLDHFHDLYTYIVYAIVFILWIVWFEKYGGLGFKFSNLSFKTTE